MMAAMDPVVAGTELLLPDWNTMSTTTRLFDGKMGIISSRLDQSVRS